MKNAPPLSNANRWWAHERRRLLLSSSPTVRPRRPGAGESISSGPSRWPAGAGAEQRASYGGGPLVHPGGRRVRRVHGRRARAWSSEPVVAARRDGGSMEIRLRRRSPPALALSISGSVEAAALEDGEPGRPWSSHPPRREQRPTFFLFFFAFFEKILTNASLLERFQKMDLTSAPWTAAPSLHVTAP
jgi:hypothetical protein